MSGSKSSDRSFARAASLPPESGGEHPLGLTVHTLPAAGDAMATAQRARHGRWKMFGVLLICAAPVVASYFTYYVVRPEGRRNFGELIQPQRTMPDLTATALDGTPVPLGSLKGQWLLVSVAGGACDAMCQTHLYLQRQLRESVGKEKDRVDWVWLVNDGASPPPELAPALQKATVLRMDATALDAWLTPATGHQLAEHLYVVDPMGNWMMRFPAAMDAAGAAKAKRDLERLLRASSSWDDAGRPAKP
jgi:cytochrome oxidase Cu insertion factor (SCO1/SenC/PrrC family)